MSDNVGIKFTGDVTDLKGALKEGAAAVTDFGNKGNKALNDFSQAGQLSAKQVAFAMRGVPAQFTDIVTSLQAGQNPMTVLLQQGGQLKDMFGGIGPAARALGGYVTGLINPFSLAAGAAGALAYAFYEGSQEGAAFNKSVIMSGYAAGVTSGQLKLMAERIDGVVGTQAGAAEALAQFAASGNIAGDSIERFTTIAIKLEKETGQAVKATVEQFSELGRAPVEASAKLNESTHYLTVSVWMQIKALEEQGRIVEAGALAQKAYADATETRLSQMTNSLGFVERAWRATTGAVKEFWDAALGIGRADSLQDKLSKVSAEIAKGRAPFDPSAFGGNAEARAKLQANIALQASLQEMLRLETKSADTAKANTDQVRARISFDKEGDQFLSKREKRERDVTEARIKGAAAGASTLEIEQRVAQIRDKYKDKAGISAGLQVDKAQLNLDIAAIKKANEELVGNYANAEKIIESLRAAGMLTDREYFEAKRGFINLDTEAKTDALQKEIARYQEEDLIGKSRIDNEKKIAAAQAAIVILQANNTAKKEVLANQELGAINRLKLGYLSARQAAQDYFDTSERKQQRELAGIGAGTQVRDFNAGVSQIEDKYGDQRRDLSNERARLELEGKFTDDARAQYEVRLGIINEFQEKSLESFRKGYTARKEAETDWAKGASEALTNYYSESQNVFKQTEDLVTNAFKGMEDALVSFAKTGKLDFKSLVDSILTDIIRMQVRGAIGGVMGAGGMGNPNAGGIGGGLFSSLFSSFAGAFGFGGGGSEAMIGNMGVEALIPGFDGGGHTGDGSRTGGLDGKGGFMAMLHPQETVVDHAKGQTLGGSVINNYSFGAGVSRAEAYEGYRRAKAEAVAEVVEGGRRRRF